MAENEGRIIYGKPYNEKQMVGTVAHEKFLRAMKSPPTNTGLVDMIRKTWAERTDVPLDDMRLSQFIDYALDTLDRNIDYSIEDLREQARDRYR